MAFSLKSCAFIIFVEAIAIVGVITTVGAWVIVGAMVYLHSKYHREWP
ncbi:MAG: hypothetical protein ACI8ZT_002287 [Bacteroidia bacterium]|jgi:hypothetical protein